MSTKHGLAILIIVSLASVTPAAAQQPEVLPLRVVVDRSLHARYSVDDSTVRNLENALTKELVETLKDGYWKVFCWRLEPDLRTAPLNTAELQVQLRKRQDNLNWEMELKLVPAGGGNIGPTLEPISIFPEGTYPLQTGPDPELLPRKLSEWVTERYFKKNQAQEIHKFIRERVPAGRGIAVPPPSPNLPPNSGLVFWDLDMFRPFADLRVQFLVGAAGRIKAIGTSKPYTYHRDDGQTIPSLIFTLGDPSISNLPVTECVVYLDEHPFDNGRMPDFSSGLRLFH